MKSTTPSSGDFRQEVPPQLDIFTPHSLDWGANWNLENQRNPTFGCQKRVKKCHRFEISYEVAIIDTFSLKKNNKKIVKSHFDV